MTCTSLLQEYIPPRLATVDLFMLLGDNLQTSRHKQFFYHPLQQKCNEVCPKTITNLFQKKILKEYCNTMCLIYIFSITLFGNRKLQPNHLQQPSNLQTFLHTKLEEISICHTSG